MVKSLNDKNRMCFDCFLMKMVAGVTEFGVFLEGL